MVSVLHVASYFPPDRMGGVGEVVAHLHRALLERGHNSLVLTTGVSKADGSVRRIARTPGGFSLASGRFTSLAQSADVVHIHHGEGAALLLAMRARSIQTPVLLTLHVNVTTMRRSLGRYSVNGLSYHRDSWRQWMHRQITMRMRSALDNIALRMADRVSFICRSAAVDVLGPDVGGRATVIYNGLPELAAAPEAEAAPVDLLFVGTNTARKRVELLPSILAEVRKQRPEARLRVAGFARDENSELIDMAHRLGVLDAIDFAGRMPSGALGRHYRSARVLVVPSVYEGLPMVILEAMQQGLPVVATRASGHPEVIEDGVSGLLVAMDDPVAMAHAVLRVLSDASLSDRFASAGPAVVADRFSVEQQVRGYLAEYDRLVRGASCRNLPRKD
jgi:glycosyltransferase involved in cell wall biosynthesis